jgi:S1-C subfamily serine protease
VRGLGLPLGKGYFITDAAHAEGKHPVAIHHEGKDVPANVVKLDSKRGLVLLQCAAIPTQAGTFLARDGAVFGQGIFVASMTLNSSRRGFEPVTMTTGIVGRLIDSTRFQHDAPLVPDAVGGFVLSERMEVLGVFFSPETRSLGKQSSSAGASPAPRGITECHRSELLDELLGDSSKGKRLPGVPELRRGSLGSEKQAAADLLRKSCALVVSTREIMKTPPASTAASNKPAAGAGGGNAPGPGKSLSASGIRHNSGCRYFNAAKPCQPGEGTPCKICGG